MSKLFDLAIPLLGILSKEKKKIYLQKYSYNDVHCSIFSTLYRCTIYMHVLSERVISILLNCSRNMNTAM